MHSRSCGHVVGGGYSTNTNFRICGFPRLEPWGGANRSPSSPPSWRTGHRSRVSRSGRSTPATRREPVPSVATAHAPTERVGPGSVARHGATRPMPPGTPLGTSETPPRRKPGLGSPVSRPESWTPRGVGRKKAPPFRDGVMIPLPLKWGGLCLDSKVVCRARPAAFPTPRDPGQALCLRRASEPQFDPSRDVPPRWSCPGPGGLRGPTGDDPRCERAGSAFGTVAPEPKLPGKRVRVQEVERLPRPRRTGGSPGRALPPLPPKWGGFRGRKPGFL
jgi:hypothetical protein